MDHPTALQFVLGCITLACASMVVFSKNPVPSALFLMANLFFTGALYIGQGALFIGAAQILIYAGAIAVLFVFMVMLLDMREIFAISKQQRARLGLSFVVVAGVAAALLFSVTQGFSKLPLPGWSVTPSSDVATAAQIAENFVSKYMLPFQITGLLLMAAIMGAVVLSKGLRKHA
jgi:NADH-quinone oxidoreductase subunit J